MCVTGKKKQLRVVRVEPRNGRRVLINGYAIAHLGGVAYDSVTRHHDVIEIQSGSESEEEADVKPDPEPPAKRQRARKPKRKVAMVLDDEIQLSAETIRAELADTSALVRDLAQEAAEDADAAFPVDEAAPAEDEAFGPDARARSRL